MPNLRTAAQAALENKWHPSNIVNAETGKFQELASPRAVLELYERIDELAHQERRWKKQLQRVAKGIELYREATTDEDRSKVITVIDDIASSATRTPIND